MTGEVTLTLTTEPRSSAYLVLANAAELFNTLAQPSPEEWPPDEADVLDVLVELEHAIDVAPADVRPALEHVATPLRRLLVVCRTGESLDVDLAPAAAAVTVVYGWLVEHAARPQEHGTGMSRRAPCQIVFLG